MLCGYHLIIYMSKASINYSIVLDGDSTVILNTWRAYVHGFSAHKNTQSKLSMHWMYLHGWSELVEIPTWRTIA